MLAALLVALLSGVSQLDDAVLAQLRTAADGSRQLDEAALYPLLRDALARPPGDESGARIPDYDAILADPAAHRGELVLIEGRFAGRPRRIPLSRAGGWGDALTEWGLIVRDDPPPEVVAMVYLIDPDDSLNTPRLGQPVRLPARFYKTWLSDNMEGEPTLFLTFIARAPTATPADNAAQPTGGANLALWLVILVAAFAFAFWRLSKLGVRPKPYPTRSMHRGDHHEPPEPEPDTDLPPDTAEALDELKHRHGDDSTAVP